MLRKAMGHYEDISLWTFLANALPYGVELSSQGSKSLGCRGSIFHWLSEGVYPQTDDYRRYMSHQLLVTDGACLSSYSRVSAPSDMSLVGGHQFIKPSRGHQLPRVRQLAVLGGQFVNQNSPPQGILDHVMFGVSCWSLGLHGLKGNELRGPSWAPRVQWYFSPPYCNTSKMNTHRHARRRAHTRTHIFVYLFNGNDNLQN